METPLSILNDLTAAQNCEAPQCHVLFLTHTHLTRLLPPTEFYASDHLEIKTLFSHVYSQNKPTVVNTNAITALFALYNCKG